MVDLPIDIEMIAGLSEVMLRNQATFFAASTWSSEKSHSFLAYYGD